VTAGWEPILAFWFGEDADDAAVAKRQSKLWWGGRREDDDTIGERFGAVREAAVAGRLSDWERDPRGRLALVLLVDQFSRALHRRTPQAFEHDPLARRWALEALAAGDDRKLRPIERVFLTLPLQHSESREHQERSVALLERWRAEAQGALRAELDGYLDYAKRHRDIVARFGRFPHRNAILGRTSTPEETEFLKQPGSSF
jgi:uncharacterized protein (DUF924 family)